MARKVNSKELRITHPRKEVRDYVLKRMEKSMRTIPQELTIIILEHKQLTDEKNK